jgi:hypothetical protein
MEVLSGQGDMPVASCSLFEMRYNALMLSSHGTPTRINAWSVYVIVALTAFVVFLPWVQGYFLGDDWMLLARNSGRPLPDMLRQISDASNSRWYRPLSELSLALSWSLFGLNPLGHHLANSVLHALNAVLVAAIGQRLARDLRVGLLAGLSFAVLACHTEAVVWITARHEMLATGFALLGILSYIKFRASGRRTGWIGAVLFYVVSLGFKETTLALPFLLALYDLIFVYPLQKRNRPSRLSVRQWIPWLLPMIIGAAYALFRLQVGGGYNVPFNVLTTFKNLAYYLMMEMVALPVSTYFVSRFPLVSWSVIASLVMACGLIEWMARDRIMHDRVVWFGVSWMVFALAPVILIVAERTTYFSSVGWAWIIAATVILAWNAAMLVYSSSRRWRVIFATVGILAANLVALTHRSYQWNWAADMSRDVFAQVQASLLDLSKSKGDQLWLINPPRRIEYAEALGNRTLFGVWLLQGQLGTDVKVVLLQDRDSKLSPREDMRQLLAERSVEGPVVAFYWQGGTPSEPGTLERIRLPQ